MSIITKIHTGFCIGFFLLLMCAPSRAATQKEANEERVLEDACLTLVQTVADRMDAYGFAKPEIAAYWRMMVYECHRDGSRGHAIEKLNTDLLKLSGHN